MSKSLDTYVPRDPSADSPPHPGYYPALSPRLLWQGLQYDVKLLLARFLTNLFFRFMLFVMTYVFSVPHLLKDTDCIRLVKLLPIYFGLNILVRQTLRMVVLISYSSRALGLSLFIGLVVGGLLLARSCVLRRLHLRYSWPQWIALLGLSWLLVGVDLGSRSPGGGDVFHDMLFGGSYTRPFGG
ncbi:hypothetical protein WAI453_006330 [Rhynchosporium graminicola]